MDKKLVIIGGAGSGQIAMSVFQELNTIKREWEIVGYLSDILEPGKYLGRYRIIGRSDEIVNYINDGYYCHNALYFNAKDKINRVNRFKKLNIPSIRNASAIHPTAYIGQETKIGNGVLFAPQSSTSYGPIIGNYVHVYNKAYIAHDAKIDDYVTITGHSYVGARVHVKEGAHIGVNSCIREDLVIGKYSIIGMGSVVVKDVPDYSVVIGNPARVVKMLDEY